MAIRFTSLTSRLSKALNLAIGLVRVQGDRHVPVLLKEAIWKCCNGSEAKVSSSTILACCRSDLNTQQIPLS